MQFCQPRYGLPRTDYSFRGKSGDCTCADLEADLITRLTDYPGISYGGGQTDWVSVIPKRPKGRIPDLPVTLLLGGNSLSCGSLQHLAYLDLVWFCVAPSFRVMRTGHFLVHWALEAMRCILSTKPVLSACHENASSNDSRNLALKVTHFFLCFICSSGWDYFKKNDANQGRFISCSE